MTTKTTVSGGHAVRVQDLRFAYTDVDVIGIDSFELPVGGSCAIIGPSGSGKSTFVHLLAGLLVASEGSICIFDQELGALSEAERDRFRGKHIGFIFQQFHLFPALSVLDNLLLAQRLARGEQDQGKAFDLLSRLNVDSLAKRKPSELSQGQAQRVAVARALAHAPKLVIADEPTSALDEANAVQTLDLLCELTDSINAALVVVTHDQRVLGRLDSEFRLGGGQ
ncbi:MAG: ABC transporter ATP-binding protein [Pseudomonadota bacterium]